MSGFHFVPYLVHVGYLLMLGALVARDILWLRGLLAAAQATLAVYAWSIAVPGIAGWNVLFVAINLIWVVLILRSRRAVRLPAPLAALHARHFAAFSAPEFLRFWNAGGARTALAGERLVEADSHPAELLFIVAGTARVLQQGRQIAQLPAGSFIAEMSLITGAPATADVEAETALELRAWPSVRLREWRSREPALWPRLQSALGQDLVEKIRRASA